MNWSTFCIQNTIFSIQSTNSTVMLSNDITLMLRMLKMKRTNFPRSWNTKYFLRIVAIQSSILWHRFLSTWEVAYLRCINYPILLSSQRIFYDASAQIPICVDNTNNNSNGDDRNIPISKHFAINKMELNLFQWIYIFLCDSTKMQKKI